MTVKNSAKKENRILTSKVPIFTVMSPAITTIKK